MFQETKTRTIVKMVVWKTIATFITWGTIYAFTGHFSQSMKMTLAAAILGMTAYYFHERIWNTIGWGKTEK